MTRLEWQFAAGMAILIWCACTPSSSRPTPLDFSGSWIGVTSQGQSITFTVTRDLVLTDVKVDYGFGGCSGTVSIPGNTPLQNTTGTATAAVTYAQFGSGPARTVVNFQFPSITRANGSAEFTNVPNCGSSTATWNATK